MNENVAWYEILYLLISIPGFLHTLWNLWDCIIDLRVILARGVNGARRAIAWRDIRGEIGRLLAFAVAIIAAINSLHVPHGTMTAWRAATIIAFFAMAIYKSAGAVLDRRARMIVRRDLDRKVNGDS